MKKFEGILLACDMDGTLLDSNRKISPKNEQALRHFVDEGGLFSLATGRSPGAITDYWKQLPINAPYSLLNGSMIFSADRQVLSCAGMPESTKNLIHDTLLQFPQLGCEIFIGDRIQVCQMSAITAYHMQVLHLDYERVTESQLGDTSEWCKINFTAEPETIKAVRRFLQPYTDRFCMASSLPAFLEITPSGIHKGFALEEIIKYCGIARENVYAIGDSYNDEMMLRTAHIGFAPGNADDGILQVAQVIVADNNSDAVAAAIDWLAQHM